METPVTSVGSKSGVHWMRLNEPFTLRANAADEHGLGDARHIFQEDVPFAEPGDQGEDDLPAFADDRLLDVDDDLFAGRIGVWHRRSRIQ